MTGTDERAGGGSTCPQCGATGQVDLFCDSCGAVLRARASGETTSQQSVAEPPAAEPDPFAGPADPLRSTTQIAALPGRADSEPGSRSGFFTPRPAPPTVVPGLSETYGAGWDPVKEWGNILGSEPAPQPGQPADAQPAAYDDAPAQASPPPPAPRPRGPYEFTSRRPEAVPEYEAPAPAAPAPTPAQPPVAQQPGAGGILSSLEGPGYLDSAAATSPLIPSLEDLGPSRSLDAPSYLPVEASPTAPMQSAMAPPSQSELQLRARELIVPVADNAVVERIVPVPPGMPQPSRPSVRTPEVSEIVGGVACPWCSTPNPIDRHFCRRCAMSLAGRPGEIKRRPWWRRLLDWRRRPIPYAGQRPRLRHGIGRIVRRVVLLGLVVLAIVEISLHAGNATTDVEDHFATPVQVYADSFTASSQATGHQAKLLGDGFNNTWWGSDRIGNNTGVYVEADFNQPINLLDVIITPGATTQEDVFTTESRPEVMGVTLYKPDGTSTQTTISFNDSVGPETFALRDNDITKIRFTVKSVYLGNSAPDVTQLAITQLEFFAKNASHS